MQLKKWVFILIVIGGFALPASAVEIAISCGAVGQERELCEQAVNAWAEATGHTVTVTSPPAETDLQYQQYLIELGDGDDSIDVYQIDVIWPGLLGRFFLDLREFIPDEEIDQHYPTIIDNNTVDERLVGMPWYTDVGLLYYRKDLLDKYGVEVPKDWSELADVALDIQSEERSAGNEELWGYVFQGAGYEGLTCNALEWLDAYGGGTIVDTDGNITVYNHRAIMAIARAASWVGTIAPERVIFFNEEDARITFGIGNAVFMRNWPYAWALLNDPESKVRDKVGVAPLPQGGPRGKPTGVLGGWQLAVSKFSKNPEVAADLVRYLTSKTVQKQRAIEGSYAPTIRDLYEDSEVLEANPFFETMQPILDQAVARPTGQTGQQYMAVSAYFWDAVRDVLQGTAPAPSRLAALQDQLRLVKARGGW